jgi:hypothetical protein
MHIELDHILVPAKNREQAAQQLATILGVDWGPANVGPFTAVYVSDRLTIDFDEWDGDIPKGHYCFRTDDENFDRILERLQEAKIAYRSHPHGDDDYSVNDYLGGKGIYWSQPDGHAWEVLTVSYARPANST